MNIGQKPISSVWPTSSTVVTGFFSNLRAKVLTNLFHSWGGPSFSCTSSFLWPVCPANAFWWSVFSVWFDFSLLSYFLFSATIDEGENETNDSSDDVDAIKCKTNKVKQLRLDVENLRKFISDQYAEDIGNNCRMQWVSEPVNLALPTKLTHAPS